MTNPFMPQPTAPAPAPQPNPYAQPPAQPQGFPYGGAPAALPPNPYAQPSVQPQYGAPGQDGGFFWPAGATTGAPGLVAQPGQFNRPLPPAEGGSGGPRIKDLQGRLLLVLPEKTEMKTHEKYGTSETVIATVIVLDGGPLYWGGATPQQPRQQGDVPYVIKGLWIQQTKIIGQIREALNTRMAGGPGLVLGRLWKAGNEHNAPYILADPTDQDVQYYNAYVSQVNPFTV